VGTAGGAAEGLGCHELTVRVPESREDGAVIVRDAMPADLPAAGALRVAAYLAGGFLHEDDPYMETLRGLGSGGNGVVLVAEDAGQLLGTVMLAELGASSELARHPGEADIRALAVALGAQGSGVGRLLVRAVIDRAAELGVRRLLLSTKPAMRAAHRLYESEGFRRVPELDWEPAPGVRLLGYERRVGPGDG
jgi:ribosomal protein S18 acetylase RimI-like enzyme